MRLISAVVGPDPPHAGRADGHLVLEGQQEATVGRLELGDRREVVLHGLPDGESEAVPRLQLVVSPREVVEPQAPDRLPISRQVRVSKIGHMTGPRVTNDARASYANASVTDGAFAADRQQDEEVLLSHQSLFCCRGRFAHRSFNTTGCWTCSNWLLARAASVSQATSITCLSGSSHLKRVPDGTERADMETSPAFGESTPTLLLRLMTAGCAC
jgi:hypothetical protein